MNPTPQADNPETTSAEMDPRARPALRHDALVGGAHRRAPHDTTRARDALARLCQTYWFPLYAYVRRRGHSPEDAQDLTQAFFARLLDKGWVGDADHAKGRFRCFCSWR